MCAGPIDRIRLRPMSFDLLNQILQHPIKIQPFFRKLNTDSPTRCMGDLSL